jgi:hypothetical protein
MNARNFMSALNGEMRNSDGYLKGLQSGAKAADFRNLEFVEMRADVARETEVQLTALVETMQDDSDETSAFGGAVNTWKNPGSGVGY